MKWLRNLIDRFRAWYWSDGDLVTDEEDWYMDWPTEFWRDDEPHS